MDEESIHEDIEEVLDDLDRDELMDLIEYILYLESGMDVVLNEKNEFDGSKNLKKLEKDFFDNLEKIRSLKEEMKEEHKLDLNMLIKLYREYEDFVEDDEYDTAITYLEKLIEKSEKIIEICENIIKTEEELDSSELDTRLRSIIEENVDEIVLETEMANFDKALDDSQKLGYLLEDLRIKENILYNYESKVKKVENKLEEVEKTQLPAEAIEEKLDKADLLKKEGNYREAMRTLNRSEKKIKLLLATDQILKNVKSKIKDLENYDLIKDYENKFDDIKEDIRENKHKTSLEKAKEFENRLDKKEIEEEELRTLDKKEEETFPEQMELSRSELISPTYSFLIPIFLLFYVSFEFLSVLILYPLISPSKISLYMLPITFLIGESISTLTLSFCTVVVLFIVTILSYDFKTRKLSIKRKRVIASTAISSVIALSLGTFMYTMPSSIFKPHHYLLFFLSIILVATELDLLINHEKFLREDSGDNSSSQNKEENKNEEKKLKEDKEANIEKLSNYFKTEKLNTIFSYKTSPRVFIVILVTVILFGSAVTSGYYSNSRELFDKDTDPEEKTQTFENETKPDSINDHENELKDTSNSLTSSSRSPGDVNLTELITGNADSTDRFGWNVSTANLNGDIYNDIIVGAPYNDSSDGSLSDAGAVYLYFGYKNISSDNLDPVNANVTIYGTTSNGHLGWDVDGAGDMDSDGYDDLVIGEPDNGSGSAYVFLGRESWSSEYNTGESNISLIAQSDDEDLGMSVEGIGDKENDGYEDLAVGSPNHDGNSVDEGAVYLLKGANTFNDEYRTNDPYMEVLNTPKNETMKFGFSISEAGDLNGDDYDDMVIGAPAVDETYVYYGGQDGFVIGKLNTTVSDFESGNTYRTEVISNSTEPPTNNGDIILENKTTSSGLYDIDDSGTIYDEEESTGSFDDTLEQDGNMWNIKETGGRVNVTADEETTINGTTINDYTYTYESDDDYEILEEENTDNYTYNDFEGDYSGWSTSGLWHRVDESDTYGDSHSPTHSFWYGQDSTGDYDTGGQTTGTLSSPTYNLTNANSPKLEFYHWYETESYDGEYDVCEVTVNGDVVYHRDSRDSNVGSENNFVEVTIDLSAYVGEEINVDFTFDSVDDMYNGYRGWYVDDVNVTGLATKSIVEHKWRYPIPNSNNVTFNLEAFHTNNGIPENYTFYYSTTGSGYVGTSAWTEMVTVTNTSDEDYNWTFTSDILNNTSGNIFVGVIDTDRILGHNATDRLYIDRMWFNTSGSSAYYDVNFQFDNLGSSYNRNTTLSFYGYEELENCNITVWDNTMNTWYVINDVDIGTTSTWYNSSLNLTDYIFDGKLVVRFNKSVDSTSNAWIHIDYLGLNFDPYINNGTFYSTVTNLDHDINYVKVNWSLSNYIDSPSNFNISVSIDGGITWKKVDSKNERNSFKFSNDKLMYKCEFKLQNKEESPILHWVSLSFQNRFTLLRGDDYSDFGWSVSGGNSIDGDAYDDIMVGSPVNQGDDTENLFFENFQGDGDPTFKELGWTNEDGYRDGYKWELVNPGINPHDGYVAEVDSDSPGFVDMNENITTPSIDCTRFQDITLEFWHTYDYYDGDYGQVQVSDDGGSTWNTIITYDSDSSGWQSFDISQYADNESNIKIRYHYVANYDWEWTVDDVYINGTYKYPEGRAYLFKGSSSGVKQENGKGTADAVFTGSTTGSRFGYSISMGDLNHDNYPEIYVGEPYNNSADGYTQNGGAVYMYYGRSSSSGNIGLNEAISYYGKSSDAYTGWSVSYLGKIGDTDPIAVGKPGWNGWYGNVTILGKEKEVIINYRALFQAGNNVTQSDVNVYNSSYHTLNIVLNLTAEMGWEEDFNSVNLTSWVDNGDTGNDSNYPELDYPNTRWNILYNGSDWSLESQHPNNEIMLQSTLINYKKDHTRNWTISLYLGNQTRYTVNNGSGSNWNELSTSNTWDLHWNISVNKGYGNQAYNEYGVSKFCSVFYSGKKLTAEGAPNTTVYPSINEAGEDPTVYYSANFDFNLTVYPTSYLERGDGEKIGLDNVSVYTDEIGSWVSMTNGALGKGSPSEINLYGNVQAAPNSKTRQNMTVDWEVYIPPGTPAGTYDSDQITYQIYISEP